MTELATDEPGVVRVCVWLPDTRDLESGGGGSGGGGKCVGFGGHMQW